MIELSVEAVDRSFKRLEARNKRLEACNASLLAALEEAVYRMSFDSDALGRTSTRELTQARAAIAKAKGQVVARRAEDG